MEEILSLLATVPIFDGIAPGEIESLLGCLDAKERRCEKSAYLLCVGERTPGLGLLLTGSALVIQEDFWGNRNLLSRLAPGQLFAESFACSPTAALNVSVLADSPCRVLFLNVQRLMSLCPVSCPFHNRMIRNLLSALADKNLELNQKLTHMGQRTTREKLLSYLSAQALKAGASSFEVPLSRQQLADYLSVDRSAMSAALCALRDEGILTFRKNQFTLSAGAQE